MLLGAVLIVTTANAQADMSRETSVTIGGAAMYPSKNII